MDMQSHMECITVYTNNKYICFSLGCCVTRLLSQFFTRTNTCRGYVITSDGWMDRWLGGWMGVWMDGWMDGWMNRRMDGWMDE